GMSARTSSSMSSAMAGPPSSGEGRSPRIIFHGSTPCLLCQPPRPARPSTTAPPLMPTATTTGRSRAVGRLRIRRSHRIAIMSSPAATLRNGILLPPASTSRRWWARILDAFFVLVFAGFIIGLAFALYGADAISIDAAARVALITYPLMVLLFGALYGCTVFSRPSTVRSRVPADRSWQTRRVLAGHGTLSRHRFLPDRAPAARMDLPRCAGERLCPDPRLPPDTSSRI